RRLVRCHLAGKERLRDPDRARYERPRSARCGTTAGLPAERGLCGRCRAGLLRSAAAGLLLRRSLLPAVLGMAPAFVVNAAGSAGRHVALSSAPHSRPIVTLTAR